MTKIGRCVFRKCSGLKTVAIPNGLTTIEAGLFEGCSSLSSIIIPNSVTSIEYAAFLGCSGLPDITIPNSVISIGGWAFSGCSGITKVIIGNGVKDIYEHAFSDCPDLMDVYCYAVNVPNIKDDSDNLCTNAFDGSYIEYAILHVPESSLEVYKASDPWNNFKKIVKIMPEFTLAYFIDGEKYKTYILEEGTTISPETEPIKEGYSFSGWSEIPETMPAHDVTVIGTFSINKYKLTYTVDGEEYKSFEVEYGTTITPAAPPTKEGYTFSGWNEIPETMPAHDVTVTGSFNVNSYKLTYMLDDKVYKETMYEYGATITPEPQPDGDYNTFEWIDMPQTMPAHDVVVHASYTSGIIEILMTTQRSVYIYSPNGKKLDKLQKGLNIVVLDDGTVKKIVVK